MKYKKILVKGAYGSCNFGDDLLMLVVKKILKTTSLHANIYFACSKQKYIKQLDDELKIDDSFNSDKYDLIVYGGGTQVFSFPLTKNTNRLAIVAKKIVDLFKNPERIRGVVKRLLLKKSIDISKPCVGLGLGFGPFQSDEEANRLIHKKLGNECKLLFVRDNASYSYVKQSKYDSTLTTDLCFDKNIFEFLPSIKKRQSIKKVGILLRDWADNDIESINSEKIDKIVDFFNSKSIEVVFLSFSCQHDINWRKLLQKKKCNNFLWDPNKMTIFDFLTVFNTFDVMISSRYHGLIFSTLLEIPFIGVSIEPKIDNYVNNTFFQKFTWHKPFEVENLFATFNLFEENYSKAKIETILLKNMHIKLAEMYHLELKRFFDE